MKTKNKKEKLLELWKARQSAEGHDVSGVSSLSEAEHFFDIPKKRKNQKKKADREETADAAEEE